ncbi:MBL fold metallo-hydrolase [Paenibacillus protaetiae]|uniref:MBL fold metallo-hydrolase n=1 Tax=Paenibacillus protaetiae TaxID=2509456 RepID=A0A4P6F1W6_9BACL|nr:MBL fold metallo-hydrolase [Paenibacillus protaetiae]QAY68129.1 MBL fold metallo-hydrolase [Paenibacillus protaetiae]
MNSSRYGNYDAVEQQNSFKQLKRWRKERIRKLKYKDYSYRVPCAKPDVRYLQSNRSDPSLTWIGHSTFLIQLEGLNIVTDPVWAGTMAFQKRLSRPGLSMDELPPVDIVLISHSHYDHLSISALRKLPGPKKLLVPAGLGSKLRRKGFNDITELDWWEHTTIGTVMFTFVPSQHWTRRNPWDTNRSHWGGWVMEPVQAFREAAAAVAPASAELHPQTIEAVPMSAEKAASPSSDTAVSRPAVAEAPVIYFAGDSGYFRGFKEIGRRKRIDVALMPIGAYEPEWFMGPQHVTPEESLQAFEDVKAEWFVPMHYGSFKLADDTPREALDRLEAERKARGIAPEKIALLAHGETWRLAGS